MAEEQLKGDIFWNLPSLVDYRANTELPYSISAVNLTDKDHLYMLQVKTFDIYNRQVTEDVILVNGLAWFEVSGGGRQDIDGTIILGESNVTLGVFLVERETSEVIDAIYTYLRSY